MAYFLAGGKRLAILLEKWSDKRLFGYECLAVEHKSLPKNGIFLLIYG